MSEFRHLTFDVRGVAAPQGSKRHLGNGVLVESSKALAPWRSDVKVAAERAIEDWERTRRATWQPISEPVRLGIWFWFPRPRGHYGTGRNATTVKASAPLRPHGRRQGDVEKLARAVSDALTAAGVWVDDCQVVHLVASKQWLTDGAPGARIIVTEIGA